MPSGPSRLTACFTRSVRPQLSMRKPRSCRNFASVEAASSLLEAQTQSSVLKGKSAGLTRQAMCVAAVLSHSSQIGLAFFLFSRNKVQKQERKETTVNCDGRCDVWLCLFVYICAYNGIKTTLNPRGGRAHCLKRTVAGGARSPLQAEAAWQPAGRHRCPPRSYVCVPCEPRPHGPTPSGAAAP